MQVNPEVITLVFLCHMIVWHLFNRKKCVKMEGSEYAYLTKHSGMFQKTSINIHTKTNGNP